MALRRHSWTRWAIGALAAALIVTMVTPAARAQGDLRAPLKQVLVVPKLIAVSGSAILARIGDSYRLSTDDGRTWKKAGAPCSATASQPSYCAGDAVGRVADGVLPLYDPASRTVAWYSLTANSELAGSARVKLDSFGASWSFDANGSAGRYAVAYHCDGGCQYAVISAAGAVRSFAVDKALAARDGSVITESAGTEDGRTVQVIGRVSPSGGTTELLRTAPDDPAAFSEHLDYLTLAGGLLVFQRSENRATGQVCLLVVATSATDCVTFSDGQRLLATDRAVVGLDSVTEKPNLYPIRASSPAAGVPVRLPKGANWSLPSTQDGGLPVIALQDSTHLWTARVQTDGTVKRLATITGGAATGAREPATVTALALTPTAAVGGYRATDSVTEYWTRSAASSLGAAKGLGRAPRGGTFASAARWAIGRSGAAVRLYDRNGRTHRDLTVPGRLQPELIAVSGPHLLVDNDARRLWSAGSGWTKDADAAGLFGSLVLDVSESGSDAIGERVSVRDLDGTPTPAALSYPHYSGLDGGKVVVDAYDGYALWGDLVAAEHFVETDGVRSSRVVEVRNWKTGQVVATHPGRLVAFGDGFAVLADSSMLSAWNIATGSTTELSGASAGSPVSLDGSRVAYSTSTKLVVTTVPGVATSAPRFLGAVAPASFRPRQGQKWQVDIDLSRPVGAGKLVIRDAAGAVVRRIPVPASASGSLRDIVWDGRTSAGKLVPAGARYWFTMTNRATGSSSAAVVAVDGTDRALGSVLVKG